MYRVKQTPVDPIRGSVWAPQPIIRGNITPEVLPVNDPGMVGAVATAHPATNVAPSVEYYEATAADQPSIVMRLRLRARPYNNPFVLVPDRPATPLALGVVDHQGAVTGAPNVVGDTAEHGPVSASELAALRRQRQPGPVERVSLLDRLFGKRIHPKDALGWSERQNPQVGRITPGDDYDANSVASTAVGIGNMIQVVDVRRTFDQPAGVDENRAGFPLTPTAYEPSEYRWEQGYFPTDPAGTAGTDWTDRIRAGAADPRQARPGKMPRTMFFAPIDKTMAERLTGQKGVARAPIAAQPIRTRSEDKATVATGGSNYATPAPGMEAVALQPNTDRQIPTPWDQNLVDSGSASQLRRKWRL